MVQLLVENTGRIAYGRAEMGSEMAGKGLIGPVWLENTAITGWTIFPLPLDQEQMRRLAKLDLSSHAPAGAGTPAVFYMASFEVKLPHGMHGEEGVEVPPVGYPPDTFLSCDRMHKGMVWVNGVHLGRLWNDVGPQRSLYVPGPYLHWGSGNNLTVLEQMGGPEPGLVDCVLSPSGAA